jgi:hypothetical protein
MNISPLGSHAQEAMETAAQTRAEAAQGDVQAKLKLAQMVKSQAQVPTPVANTAKAAPESAEAAPSAPPPPTGAVLNVKR